MRKSATEKITSLEEQIKHLENQKKELLQKEKEKLEKAKNDRYCRRGGRVEKLLPELANFTDEQFEIFLNKALLSEETKRIIADISAEKSTSPRPAKPPQNIPDNNQE